MPKLWLALRLAVVALVVSARPAWSQGPPRVDIQPPSAATGTAVAARNVITENPFDGLMRNGFPTNLHFRVEVWTTGRWFDDVVARVEWDVQLRYNLVDHTYDVVRRVGDGTLTSLGSYTRFSDARAASELAFAPPLALPAGRRGYVSVQVDVQSLQISDLAETQRWLEGEARPAVTGRRNPGTALTRGLRTLVTRLLGGEVRHLEKRSAEFQF
jgi:hypothetical protein